ncbi:MAG: hypothetical protein NTV80_16820 [Verrucomicrobia bacterium]|nr:hypothetical protein [Verrucomicrobiota bacterium]
MNIYKKSLLWSFNWVVSFCLQRFHSSGSNVFIWAVVACLTIFNSRILASEHKGVLFVVVRVTDETYKPITGAHVSVPVKDGESAFFQSLGVADSIGKTWLEIQKEGAKTDRFGCAIVPFLGGEVKASLIELDSMLPEIILITKEGFQSIRLTINYNAYKRPMMHLPLIEIVLSATKNKNVGKFENHTIVIKAPP